MHNWSKDSRVWNIKCCSALTKAPGVTWWKEIGSELQKQDISNVLRLSSVKSNTYHRILRLPNSHYISLKHMFLNQKATVFSVRSPIAVTPSAPHTRMSQLPYMSQSWVTWLVTSDNFHKQTSQDLWIQLLVYLSWAEFANQDLTGQIDQPLMSPMCWRNSTNTAGCTWRYLEGLPEGFHQNAFNGNFKQQDWLCSKQKTKEEKII